MTVSSYELNTLSSIMRFAVHLEETLGGFYEKLSQSDKHSVSKEIFTTLMEGSKKRGSQIERAHREDTSEMILERISGLDQRGHH